MLSRSGEANGIRCVLLETEFAPFASPSNTGGILYNSPRLANVSDILFTLHSSFFTHRLINYSPYLNPITPWSIISLHDHRLRPAERSMMSVINGFELIREEHIPELNSLASLYRHVQTGAELLSLDNDDENKVFGITFRTPPPIRPACRTSWSTRCCAVRANTRLKEPFVELVKGSLNTFLNAFTYPDKTCYPVASQNVQDFYNLIDVYLDAVFYPLITPYTLKQEGWHYELDDPAGPDDFQRRGLQRDEGRLFLAGRRAGRGEPGAPLPRQHLRRGQRRRPGPHPRPDLRAVQRLSPDLLPPLQRAHLLLRRR